MPIRTWADQTTDRIPAGKRGACFHQKRNNSMKIFYSSIRLFLVVLLGTVLSVSCSDDESGCGTPEITRVSTAQNRAETIAGGNMGDFIIIQGHDLCGVQSL